VDHYQRA